MAHHPLTHIWVVGSIDLTDRETATVTITQTETAARQIAEKQLAKAEYDWFWYGKRLLKQHQRDPQRRAWTFDEYATWLAALVGYVDSVPARAYLTLRDGIPITGPTGETEIIRKPG